ncbi:unnamed protein product [Knipowitschia caucasica]
MEAFLRSRGAELSGPGSGLGPVHVVLGNEACDMDSMVCALVYGYLLHMSGGGRGVVIPLLNIPAQDFVLRSDSVALLRKSGLSPELLLFRDQVDLRRIRRERGLWLTLVDHNVLADSDSYLEGAVVEVIDHHKLERVVTAETAASCLITVETVGSCATLVTEKLLQRAPELLDLNVATLLYGTILVDCVDLAPEAGKVTPKDSEVVHELETKVQSLPQRSELFTELQDQKFNVHGLNSEQMLRKDLKSVSGPDLSLGISVIYLPLQDFLGMAGVAAELSSFCQTMGFDLLLLMSISFTASQQPIRELGVFSLSQPIREQVSAHLVQAESPALLLQPISCEHPHVTAFHQGNATASRKKVLPILKDCLFSDDITSCVKRRDFLSSDDLMVPPTPVNSLVEGSPLDQGLSPTELTTRLLTR